MRAGHLEANVDECTKVGGGYVITVGLDLNVWVYRFTVDPVCELHLQGLPSDGRRGVGAGRTIEVKTSAVGRLRSKI